MSLVLDNCISYSSIFHKIVFSLVIWFNSQMILRRKDAYFMLLWLVHARSFLFFMLQWTQIGRFVLLKILLRFLSLLDLSNFAHLQILQPSRFLKEIPHHLLDVQVCNLLFYRSFLLKHHSFNKRLLSIRRWYSMVSFFRIKIHSFSRIRISYLYYK